jgi:2-oxoglutarate dehydrogenase E1 component
MVRELGHLTAHIDPLGSTPPGDPGLELSTHHLTTADLAALPASVVSGPLAEGAANALEALGRLRKAYSGSIGYEDDHIQVHEERDWLVDAIESGRFFKGFDADRQREVLKRLTEVDTFERFLDRTFLGQKRFSIEGTDMLVPMLDAIIHEAAVVGTREVVMGMAHRGRLNVLAHILGKPYAQIISEFGVQKKDEGTAVSGTGAQGWTGDVKYHLGAELEYSEDGQQVMPITLAPNPSHLEYVDPVVVGRARAAQETIVGRRTPLHDPTASLAILMHGDAAFPGQGIVAETLNMSQLAGYNVGGTIHIITNNQIGFTTTPRDGRSTLYASDLAKGFEIPIVHVNADDVEACIAVARMAHAYRERFGKDFLIDLVGYRRHGHNESDEPAFTQPRMYEKINAHPTVREIWAKELERRGVVTRDEATAMVKAVEDQLLEAKNTPSGKGLSKDRAPEVIAPTTLDVETRVSVEKLTELNNALLERPMGFTTNAKLDRVLVQRKNGLNEPNGILWNHAEALAFAAILSDGTPIRLTGQDVERGTFTTRHAVFYDPTTGERYVPLQEIPQSKASFAVYNSPLSESAVLGFEYGYSIHSSEALVLWEAQFGDFGNSAQVIIDQFIVSGNSKWRQTPALVMLLPHGYEGSGPEHSSGRLERYLQLAAADNVRIVNCTTAAQYFHVLRRQAALLKTAPRPLIVMSPKQLLRHPKASSSLSELASGRFYPVLDDAEARQNPDEITRLVLCSGHIYVDLVTNPAYDGGHKGIAIGRVEQLYPFPTEEVRAVVEGYPNLREIVWLQEEPRNMGAWFFVSECLREIAGDRFELTYVGRVESASPAEGSARRHSVEQNRIITAALSEVPAAKLKRSGVKNAR